MSWSTTVRTVGQTRHQIPELRFRKPHHFRVSSAITRNGDRALPCKIGVSPNPSPALRVPHHVTNHPAPAAPRAASPREPPSTSAASPGSTSGSPACTRTNCTRLHAAQVVKIRSRKGGKLPQPLRNLRKADVSTATSTALSPPPSLPFPVPQNSCNLRLLGPFFFPFSSVLIPGSASSPVCSRSLLPIPLVP